MFAALYVANGHSMDTLVAVAREFSPRLDVCGAGEITVDLSGLQRLFGDAPSIARELIRTAAERGQALRVAVAGTRTAARLLAYHADGVTTIEAGTEAAALAALPLNLLARLLNGPTSNDPNANDPNAPNDPVLSTLIRWGVKTLGHLAALPPDAVAARLGQGGVRLQRLARGEDVGPLVPAVPEERFEQAFDLEWPIDGLEPLAFVLSRVMEALSAHLERRGRGAAVLHIRLHLVTRTLHERSLQLPAPIRDARTLRALALLDLESNPPPAAIDRVVVAIDPTPARILQFSLLTRPLPSPDQLSTLMARLHALMGETRCGSPVAVDSWQPGAMVMKPFAPKEQGSGIGDQGSEGSSGSPIPDPRSPVIALRRFRFPVPVRVTLDNGKPAHVITSRRGLAGGRVETCAGPWRTSGRWWEPDGGSGHAASWDRDEWDVTLGEGTTYRLFRDRDGGRWFVEGIID